jgi:predicted nucleic acid-binding protein
MKLVFADSSAIIAYFYNRDENHQRARFSVEKILAESRLLVVTDYIFDECVTGIKSNAGHESASKAGGFILSSNVIELIWLDEELKRRAWEYFKLHADKGYSFTDCTSFVLMKEMKLSHYLAFDKHFEQAGFRLFPS